MFGELQVHYFVYVKETNLTVLSVQNAFYKSFKAKSQGAIKLHCTFMQKYFHKLRTFVIC